MKRQFTRAVVTALALLSMVPHAEAQRPRESSLNQTLNMMTPRRYVRSNLQMWVIGSGGMSQVSSNFDQSTQIRQHPVYGGGLLVEAGRFTMTGQTGLLYFQEGLSAAEEATVTTTTGASTSTAKASADVKGEVGYIGIPALARFNPLRKGRSRLSFGVGLMPAFVVSSNMRGHTEVSENGVLVKSDDKETTDTEGLRKVNLMAIASIGGDIGVSRSSDMRLEALYRRSILPLGERNDSGVYSNSVVVNLGFGFDI